MQTLRDPFDPLSPQRESDAQLNEWIRQLKDIHGYPDMGGCPNIVMRLIKHIRWQQEAPDPLVEELVGALRKIQSECADWKKYTKPAPHWIVETPETVKSVDAIADAALQRVGK